MCITDPATAAIVLAATNTVMSAAGSYAQGQQQKKNLDFQAKVAQQKAAEAEQKSRDAINAGIAAEQKKRMEVNQRVSAARAQTGASGVDVGSGSALDHFGDLTMLGEQDALTSRNAAKEQSNDYLLKSNDLMNDATSLESQGDYAAAKGVWGAADSLLGSAGKVANSMTTAQDIKGVFGIK